MASSRAFSSNNRSPHRLMRIIPHIPAPRPSTPTQEKNESVSLHSSNSPDVLASLEKGSAPILRPIFKQTSTRSSFLTTPITPISATFYFLSIVLLVMLLSHTSKAIKKSSLRSEIVDPTNDPISLRNHLRWNVMKENVTVIYSSLLRQKLSHISFHGGRVKDSLLKMVCDGLNHAPPFCTVVVVGVSYGEEVIRFAKTGHRVFGVEAMKTAAVNAQKKADSSRRSNSLDVRIFHAAATDEKDAKPITITYNGKKEKSPAKRVDDLLPSNVHAVCISIDIQGSELYAVRGMPRTISQSSSIWVEVLSCRKENVELLKLLSERFYLFDMIPWGARKGKEASKKIDSFADVTGRPTNIEEWDKWFCDLRKTDFKWVQTDFVGIEKSLIDGDNGKSLIRTMNEIWTTSCREKRTCPLRELQ